VSGWLTGARDDFTSSYTFGWDLSNKLKSVDNQNTFGMPRLTLAYGYNDYYDRNSLQDSAGRLTNYNYDLGDRLTIMSMTVSGSQGPQVTFNYDNANRLTSIVRAQTTGGASITTTLQYDNMNRMTTMSHASSQAGALATYSYGYDNGSRVQSYTGPEGNVTFSYYDDNELTNANGARTEAYTYDANGNRTIAGYATNKNRVTNDGTYSYSYDDEGNMLSKTGQEAGQTVTYTYNWDYRNRLTEVDKATPSGTTTVGFIYDVFDRRIAKKVNGAIQFWTVYDGQNPYADFDSGGNLTSRYLYGDGIDQLLGRFQGTTTVTWYLTDGLGSVRQIAGVDGSIKLAITYDSYGNILSQSTTTYVDRFKFTSREWDSEIGLQYNRARYYDPRIGRFISEDPLGFGAGDANVSRYVGNNPTVGTDPSGFVVVLPWAPGWPNQLEVRAGDRNVPKPRADGIITPNDVPEWVPKGVTCFVIFDTKGGIQGTSAGPIPRRKYPSPGENWWIVPLRPGDTWWFERGSGIFYPGVPEPKDRDRYFPVPLQPGTGLIFCKPGRGRNPSEGGGLDDVTKRASRAKIDENNQVLVVVPPPVIIVSPNPADLIAGVLLLQRPRGR